MSTFAHNEQQNTFLMDPVHIYIYVCVYIYMWPGPSGVLYSYLRGETQEGNSGGTQAEESKATGPGAAI